MGSVSSKDIADFLSSPLVGENLEIFQVSTFNKPINASVVFSKNKFSSFPSETAILILCPIGTLAELSLIPDGISLVEVENPRLAFAKVVGNFFVEKKKSFIHPSAIISDTATIHESVFISANTIIADGVVIGENTVINNNVVISENVKIGNNCYIKSGAVIGEDGFGFDFESNGIPVRIPHIGSVVISDNVEIGSNTTIARGTLDNTIIQNDVKIDDQVFIAHNCNIGEGTLIISQAQISGSVSIGKFCWIGPNASIIQKVTISDKALIGIGAVVTEDVGISKKVMGLEAFELRNLIKVKKILGLKK